MQNYKKTTNFASSKAKSARSSMDRISDSGSDDWGSTPHGRTTIPPQAAAIPRLLLFSFPTAALQPSLQPHFPLKVVNDLKDLSVPENG